MASYLRRSDYLIIKAHGCVDDSSKIVFTHKQYNTARYTYASFYRIMDALLLTHTFFFIGCGINDPDIQLTLENSNFSFPNCKPHYFVTVDKEISNEVANSLKTNRNLSILTYKNNDGTHDELKKNLKVLSKQVENKRADLASRCVW